MPEQQRDGLQTWARVVAAVVAVALLALGVLSIFTTDGGVASAAVVIIGGLLVYIALADARITGISTSGVSFEAKTATAFHNLMTNPQMTEEAREQVAREATPLLPDLPASVQFEVLTVTEGAATKRDLLAALCDELGLPRIPLGVGSSLPSPVFGEAARQYDIDQSASMPDIARMLVEGAGLTWEPSDASTGSTVTASGLRKVVAAVRILKQRKTGEAPAR